jgi:hypothetical protein
LVELRGRLERILIYGIVGCAAMVSRLERSGASVIDFFPDDGRIEDTIWLTD